MKRIITSIVMSIALSGSMVLFAQTPVNGIINANTTWTLANSPYIVTGNLLVSSGVTLTIEPGVLVKFGYPLYLQVDGTLIAQGTSSHKIIFTSDTLQGPGSWGHISFTTTSTDAVYDIHGNYISGNILEYCIVQY